MMFPAITCSTEIHSCLALQSEREAGSRTSHFDSNTKNIDVSLSSRI